jgi:hypothetical protein
MFSSDKSRITGFTIDNQGGARAIAPQKSYGSIITNNVVVNSYRGIQGDWNGRPEYLIIKGNEFHEVEYGIAGTEDIAKMPLVIVENTFHTSIEGIGLGEGVVLETDWTVEKILGNNKFPITSGYAIGDYREGTLKPTKYTPNGYILVESGDSIQKAIDFASTGDVIQVGTGVFDSIVIDKSITLTNGSSPVIDCGGTGNGILIQAPNVTIDGFEIRNCKIGIRSYGGPSNFGNLTVKNTLLLQLLLEVQFQMLLSPTLSLKETMIISLSVEVLPR